MPAFHVLLLTSSFLSRGVRAKEKFFDGVDITQASDQDFVDGWLVLHSRHTSQHYHRASVKPASYLPSKCNGSGCFPSAVWA
jgi:hypothetical protein